METSPERMTYANYLKKSRHPRMDTRRRAKIFLPFNALEGLCEELTREEKVPSPRRCLSEDERELLDEVLFGLEVGMRIRVTYYSAGSSGTASVRTSSAEQGGYRTKTGKLTRIDRDRRFLQVVEAQIPFRDIYRIEQASGSN